MYYNNKNQLISSTDYYGNSVIYEYDNRGNTIKVTTGVNTAKNIEGTSVTYTYDSLNRVISETNQLGNTEYYAYDSHNNIISSKDRKGTVTTYTYDIMNRLLDTRAGEKEFISYTYDNLGNVLTMTDLTGTTTYVYNEYKLLTDIQNPDESKISYYYDNSKKLKGVLDYDGENVLYTHDLMGNVASVSNDKTTLATYTYNGINTLASATYTGQGTETYIYDSVKAISQVNFTLEDGSLLNSYSYTYDDADLISYEHRIENGNVSGRFYTYDCNRRLIREDCWLDNEKYTAYDYDANNNMTNKDTYYSNYTVNTSYIYNDANQLLTETETATGDTTYTKTTSYSYDLNGNMVRKTVSVDSSVIEDYTYDFDAFNRLKSIDTTYYYSDGTADVYEYYYTYNGNNELSTVSTYKNDDLISIKKYYWDRGYIIKDVTTTTEGGNTKKTITKRNDVEVAKVASFTEERSAITFNLPENAITCTQTVNGNKVQIAGKIPDANTKNQVSLVVSTDVNNVNENNIVHIDQKTSTTSGKFSFTFTLPQNSGVSSYGYIIGTDADTETYIGVINIQQGGNEDDDEDDDDHGGDTDITGTTVTVKYYLGADGVFAQTDTDGTSYLLKNGHGDTVTIVCNGNVVDYAKYDAYGNVENPQSITAYTYANYYYDSHSGMYYLRNRFYDPSIARFISEDTYWTVDNMIYGNSKEYEENNIVINENLLELISNSSSNKENESTKESKIPDNNSIIQSNNLYAYCGNNPLKHIDISGDNYALTWGSLTWWLAGADGPLPVGDAIVVGGIVVGAIIDGVNIMFYGEHTKGARPSTRGTHEKGQARKQRDAGGEKGDARRTPRKDKKK